MNTAAAVAPASATPEASSGTLALRTPVVSVLAAPWAPLVTVSFIESPVRFTEPETPLDDARERGLRLACVLVRDEPFELLVEEEPVDRPFVFARDDREGPDLDAPDFPVLLVLDLVVAIPPPFFSV